MNINLVASPAFAPTPTKTLNLRLNRLPDGTATLEAQTISATSTTGTGWTPILTFPTGQNDGLLRMRRETGLPSSLADFINTGGGNDSILMIRAGDRD